MARAKGTGKKGAPAARSAARLKATPATAPRAREEKRAIIYPRIGFEEVGTEVASEWQKAPEVLRLQSASPEQLLALIQKAIDLQQPEEDAKKAYTAALRTYNQAHAARMVALDAAWRSFLYVNEHSKTEAKYSEGVAELFQPMHEFMGQPAAKRLRDKKRAAKQVK